MTKTDKKPLNFNEYEKYEIPQEYMAFEVNFLGINPEQCEDLEYEYLSTGYKLFNSDLTHANEGKFNLKLIIAKSTSCT